MANLETKFNRKDVGFFKYDGKVYAGEIISIDAHLACFQKDWWVFYNFQTGEDCGILQGWLVSATSTRDKDS